MEHLHEQEPPLPAKVPGGRSAPSQSAAVLALQRKAGNAAVAQLARKGKKEKKEPAKVRGLGTPVSAGNLSEGEIRGRANSAFTKQNLKEAVSWYEALYDHMKAKNGGKYDFPSAQMIWRCYRDLGFKEAEAYWKRVMNGEEPSENAPDSGKTHA